MRHSCALQVVRALTVVAMWPLLAKTGYGLDWREGIVLVRWLPQPRHLPPDCVSYSNDT